MMGDVPLSYLLFASAVVFTGAAIQSCTGFGLALVVMPVLLMFLDLKVAVPMLTMLSLVNTTLVAIHGRRHVRGGILVPLALGGMVGLVIGISLLDVLDGPVLKAIVGVVVIVTAVLLLTGWSRPVRNQKLGLLPVGVVGGILGGCSGIGGPPAILFLNNQEVPKLTFRATLASYFFILNSTAVFIFWCDEKITGTVITGWTFLVPALLIGGPLGTKVMPRVPEVLFRRATLLLVATMGGFLLINNLATAWEAIAPSMGR